MQVLNANLPDSQVRSSPVHLAAFEKTNSTGHVLSTAGLTQCVQELRSTTCIRDIKSSHTPSGVGKVMNSSMRQPGSFLQGPCFTKVHASRGPSCPWSSRIEWNFLKEIISTKTGDELPLMLSQEEEAFWEESRHFQFLMFLQHAEIVVKIRTWSKWKMFQGGWLTPRIMVSLPLQLTDICWSNTTCQALSKELSVLSSAWFTDFQNFRIGYSRISSS